MVGISIHALREEGDCIIFVSELILKKISIHALREEGDKPRQTVRERKTDFYPRPPRGGRLSAAAASQGNRLISIHALREEGDGETSITQGSGC